MAYVGKYHAGIVKVCEAYVYLVATGVDVSFAFEASAEVLEVLRGSEYARSYAIVNMKTYRKQRVCIDGIHDVVAGRGENDVSSELDALTVDKVACMGCVESAVRVEWTIIAWQIERSWLTTATNREGEGLEVTGQWRESLLTLA